MESCILSVLYFKNLSQCNIISRKSLTWGSTLQKTDTTKIWYSWLSGLHPHSGPFNWLDFLSITAWFSFPSLMLSQDSVWKYMLNWNWIFGAFLFLFFPLTWFSLTWFALSYPSVPSLCNVWYVQNTHAFDIFFVFHHHTCEGYLSSPQESHCYRVSTGNMQWVGDSYQNQMWPERTVVKESWHH